MDELYKAARDHSDELLDKIGAIWREYMFSSDSKVLDTDNLVRELQEAIEPYIRARLVPSASPRILGLHDQLGHAETSDDFDNFTYAPSDDDTEWTD